MWGGGVGENPPAKLVGGQFFFFSKKIKIRVLDLSKKGKKSSVFVF